MTVLETSKFRKLRGKLKDGAEREALREAVIRVLEDPESGKKLKGEFQDLRSLRYSVRGQPRRLVYRIDEEDLVLFTFGPRQDVYR